MHDPAAERILVHLAPHYGEGEGVRALGGGCGRPCRLDFDARIREGSGRIFFFSQVFPLRAIVSPLCRSALCAAVAESAGRRAPRSRLLASPAPEQSCLSGLGSRIDSWLWSSW